MMMSLALFQEEYRQSSNSRIGNLGNHVLQSEIKKKKRKKKRRYIYKIMRSKGRFSVRYETSVSNGSALGNFKSVSRFNALDSDPT